MKRQIRQNVFETNSSSTHALSISGEQLNSVPESLHFECGEFGWECEIYRDVESKASYLWTYAFNYGDSEKWEEYLTRVCKEVGVKNVTFQKSARIKRYGVHSYEDTGYIDHGYELESFMSDLLNDENLLKQFLFCSYSGIETGNDNDDEGVGSVCDNPIYEFYKGN